MRECCKRRLLLVSTHHNTAGRSVQLTATCSYATGIRLGAGVSAVVTACAIGSSPRCCTKAAATAAATTAAAAAAATTAAAAAGAAAAVAAAAAAAAVLGAPIRPPTSLRHSPAATAAAAVLPAATRCWQQAFGLELQHCQIQPRDKFYCERVLHPSCFACCHCSFCCCSSSYTPRQQLAHCPQLSCCAPPPLPGQGPACSP